MKYSPEIDAVTKMLNENLIFPASDKSLTRNAIYDKAAKKTIFDFNPYFKISNLETTALKVLHGGIRSGKYSVKGMQKNTMITSSVVAAITGLNPTNIDHTTKAERKQA